MATGVFLFTDIEGSTRHWVEDPKAMGAALEQHDRLLRGVVVGAGGTAFNHTGDGLACWFPSVASAVVAAVEGQRALAAADWGEVEPPLVRMAIHAGDADARDDGWFGPALNRCARLMGIAHGSQVLLSGSARALLVEGLPSGLSVIPLGRHRLRDLRGVEDVFQLAGDGLARAFPPLRSRDESRGNLSLRLTSFHGRQVEIDELATALGSQRLISLVGPGGMGKTRLALEVAASVADKFPDGVWVVELAPLSDGGAVDHALVATLGLQPRGGWSPLDLVVEALRDWHVLIVLDNCEHLLAAASTLTTALLRNCPGVVVLATSREPLHVAGEHVWLTRGLAIEPESVELFAERAAAVRPGFVLDGVVRPIAAGICRQLDGMPLAIELAAARLTSLSAAELASRLNQRFRLLTAAAPNTVEARHATLHTVVAWSYELLTEPQQRLLDRLAVFAGGFDLAAAHAVCGSDGDDELDTLELLDDLVEQSLVQVDERSGRSRYSLLETVRQFGVRQWSDDDRSQLGDRHCAHYASMAETSWAGRVGPDDGPWLDWFDDEFDNLRLAFSWACEHGDVARAAAIPAHLVTYASSYPIELWSWAEHAINLPGVENLRYANRLMQQLAHSRYLTGDHRGGVTWARRARALEEAGTCPIDPGTPAILAPALGYCGDLEEALRESLIAEEVATRLGSNFHRAYACYLQVYTLLGLRRPATDAAARGQALADPRGTSAPVSTHWSLPASLSPTRIPLGPERSSSRPNPWGADSGPGTSTLWSPATSRSWTPLTHPTKPSTGSPRGSRCTAGSARPSGRAPSSESGCPPWPTWDATRRSP